MREDERENAPDDSVPSDPFHALAQWHLRALLQLYGKKEIH